MRVFGLAEDGVGYVDSGPHAAGIPDDVKAKVAAFRAEVVEKRRVVPSR
jgi:basic membrane protein A